MAYAISSFFVIFDVFSLLLLEPLLSAVWFFHHISWFFFHRLLASHHLISLLLKVALVCSHVCVLHLFKALLQMAWFADGGFVSAWSSDGGTTTKCLNNLRFILIPLFYAVFNRRHRSKKIYLVFLSI